jgi:hypothetical protein
VLGLVDRFGITISGQAARASQLLYGLGGSSFRGSVDFLTVKSASSSDGAQNTNSTSSINTEDLYMSFPDLYNKLDDDQRRACVLGDNIIGDYDCLVAGTSLIIHRNGNVLAVPLPNIYRP